MRTISILIITFLSAIITHAQEQPSDTICWLQLIKQARQYRENSNTFKALSLAQQAFSINKSDTVMRELAACYFTRGNYNECLHLCKLLLIPTIQNPIPDSTEISLIARCYEKKEQPDSVLKYQLIEAHRNIENQNNTISLAKNLINQQKCTDAVSILERYRQIDSTNNVVNTALAYAYYSAGLPTKAISLYSDAIQKGDNRTSTFYYYGMACLQKGKREIAEKSFFKADSIAKGKNALAKAMLGLVQLSNDTIALQGEQNILTAIEMMQPDPLLLYRLYFGLGDYYVTIKPTIAINYFKTAEKYNPTDAQLHYQLGYCYYMQGDEDKEYEHWTRYIELTPTEKEISFITAGVMQRLEKIREKKFMKGDLKQ